jgi:hypothetical protein
MTNKSLALTSRLEAAHVWTFSSLLSLIEKRSEFSSKNIRLSERPNDNVADRRSSYPQGTEMGSPRYARNCCSRIAPIGRPSLTLHPFASAQVSREM